MIKIYLKLLFYLTCFAVVGVIAAFLFYEVVGFDRTVEVPSLIGKSVSEAEELLNKTGLSLIVGGEGYDPEIPAGNIIKQDIMPGERIKKRSEIRIVASMGAEIFSMPSFEGQRLKGAKLTLNNLGIEIGKVTKVHSDFVEEGVIIAQRPLPGNVGRNKINFLVSLGGYDVSYICPSFINMSVDDARSLAMELGFSFKALKKGSRVIFQKPEAGVIMSRGDTVEVTLGRGWGLWF
jgi:serine/threonine-protein kinase